MSNDRSVTFSITAAEVNALDGTAKTLITFLDDGVIRVPERLEIRREAGTAYTITKGDYPLTPAVGGDYPDSYTEGFEGGNVLQIYEGTVNSSSPRVWFKVKVDGFLTATTKQDRVVFPNNALREYKDNVTSLLIEYRGRGIASGTGVVSGTVFFKEYAVTTPIGR